MFVSIRIQQDSRSYAWRDKKLPSCALGESFMTLYSVLVTPHRKTRATLVHVYTSTASSGTDGITSQRAIYFIR
jgi:hypothetical protein